MKTVILDTNALMLPGRFRVDVFSQLEQLMEEPFKLAYIDKTEAELKKIIKTGSTKDKTSAKLAVILLKQKSLKSMSSFGRESVDVAITRLSNPNTAVVTLDKELKKRVKEKKAQIITLKQKKYLIQE